MLCPSCTTELPAQAAFCHTCGTPVARCESCQARLVPGAAFCVSCGTPSVGMGLASDSAARIDEILQHAAEEAGAAVVGFLFPPGRPIDRHPITMGDNTVGAGDKNHVVIKLPAISWNHALIIARPERILLQDSASTNGTFIGAQRIHRPTQVHHDEVIRLGNVELALWLRPERRA